MRQWLTVWMMLLMGLAAPTLVRAEETSDEAQAKKAQPAKAEDQQETKKSKAEESPIPRLAELRIDRFVVPARMLNLPFPGRTRTVQDILDQFDEWSKNKRIGAVLLDLGNIGLPLADIEELREGIAGLRRADKRVMAFLNGGGPNAYLLACATDEIVMAPTGMVIIPGLGRVFPFMKGHYQMLGVEFQVITAGRFKYPGFMNRRAPNKYFKEEFNALFDGLFGDYQQMIAQGRHLKREQVKELIDIAIFDADHALQRGLVDTLAYRDEFRDRFLRRMKMRRARGMERDLANVNSIQDFMELINETLEKTAEARQAVGPKIAVLHARGTIIDVNLGAGFASQVICRDDFAKVVDELRRNKSIKAVVMRIDSPGGSGYASDVIWKHLRELNATKPLVVSMGSVAASGGYYIACPARRIFARPTTITGSIGVLSIFQSSWSLLNRLDYEVAEIKRGARSLLGSPHRTLSLEDRDFLQNWMNDFYGVFIDRVAQCRKIPAEEVRKIAGGRVYTGRQALEIGLIDELGGLPDAIESAKKMANIPPSAEIKIIHYPRPGSLGEIFESFNMVSLPQAMTLLQQADQPAKPLTFDQQLRVLTHRPQALCWLAIPGFCQPVGLTAQPEPWDVPTQTPDALETALRRLR